MRLSSPFKSLGLLVLLGVLTACGGAYTPPAAAPEAGAAATGLAYTNPTGTGWALVKDSSSTATRIVLNLVGPAGLKARGVGFNLGSDGSVKFHKFADGNYVKDLGVFQLKLSTPNLYTTNYPEFYEPTLMVGGVKQGGKLLTTGLFQKDRYQPAQDMAKPICQIAIDFDAKTTGTLSPGALIPLSLVRARIIPEDIGTIPTGPHGDWTDVLVKFHMEDIQIAVGSLRAQ